MSDAGSTRGTRSRPVACARAYGLLGDLLLRGLRHEHLGVVGDIGELARALRVPFEADEEAAIHYALFGHEVFPFESAFRDRSATLGGVTSAAAAETYAAAGFAPDWSSDAPDHVGHELAFVGFLCRLQSEGGALADRARERQRAFLDDHLLAWLPALSVAVRMRAERFWSAVVELALNLALAHRAELGSDAAAEPNGNVRPELAGPDSGAGTAAAVALLDDPTTSLKDIAGHLLTPARSGLLLTRSDIASLARRLGLPRGFGNRHTMLTTLLRGAIEYDQLADLLAGLDARLVEWATVLDEYRGLWPTATGHLAAWSSRLAATRELLDALGCRARDEASSAAL